MRGLFIVPSDLEALRSKGVAHKILERDEDGLLDRVITLHPFSSHQRIEKLSPVHEVHELKPKVGGVRPLAWIRFAAHLLQSIAYTRRLITTQRMDFVRAQSPYFCGLIGYLATRGVAKFCISIHADYDMQEKISPGTAAPHIFGSRALAKRLERFLLRRADLILAVSDYIASCAERDGAPQDRIRVFRHPVDLSAFQGELDAKALAQFDIPSDRKILAGVTRLSREKLILDYIDLAKELKNQRDDFAIVIGGAGPAEAEMRRAIHQARLSDHLILLGPLDSSQVAALRRRAYLNIALLDGASLIEACAAGRPVVGYDIEWQSELVKEGVSGRLVEPGHVRKLAQACIEVMGDVGMADRMGRAARERVQQMFNHDVVIGQHRKIYGELVSARLN